MLQITNQEIAYAETILFGRIGVFDQERIDYIRELNTCDLQAVPGSGKTTVLLAKLLIIETRLPFPDNRSILVISHTNAAIDEIKAMIGKHCPKLFSSPNFVGTIQAFVDKFLAIPYYIQYFKRRPARIDDEIYKERAEGYGNVQFPGIQRVDQNNAKRYLRANNNIGSIRISPGIPHNYISNGYKGQQLTINKPRRGNGPNWSAAEMQAVRNWLVTYKRKLMIDGYLCFDDAYFLAEKYIQQFPGIISILQRRFKFIFVDEMQDMAEYQYQLLETIFGAAPDNRYQRIGDKNQAIFAGRIATAGHWIDRPLVLQLNGSHRLTPENAIIVERLGLTPVAIRGLRQHPDGTPVGIKPHLFVYKDANIDQVIPSFANVIRQFQNAGCIAQICKYPFKAVCWNTQDSPGNIRIKNFYPDYGKENLNPQVNYNSLASYLYTFPLGKSMRSVHKNLLNALLCILRQEGVHQPDGRFFSKTSLLDFVRINHLPVYEDLQRQLYSWCCNVMLNQEIIALHQIRAYIPAFLQVFGSGINQANNFTITAPVLPNAPGGLPVPATNTVSAHGIDIEVATVHATKGQTHTATLYLESHYERNIQQQGQYESQRLAGNILGQARQRNIHQYIQQSMKMAYVGFSRPTHLLGFAVHEDRYKERLLGLHPKEWEIVIV